jgi:tryptophan synthase alpha chain
MNRLDTTLSRLRAARKSGLVCYFTAGDPDYAASLSLLQGLAGAGADIIELGLPFSDPVADGPVIQAAHLRARAAGQTTARTLEMVQALRQTDADTPVVLMGYLNPVMQYGMERFMGDAAVAGVDALLLVDLPVEHAQAARAAARAAGLHLISMTAPTSDDARLKQVLADARGFVYHVTLNGTTGVQQCTAKAVDQAVTRLRAQTTLPLAVGFGIREAAQVRALACVADLIVIGSKLVETLAAQGREAALREVRVFAEALGG